METHDAMVWLLEATCAGSAAILIVLALRQPLRRRFGARIAYASWWLVAAAMLAIALPGRVEEVDAGDAAASGFVTVQQTISTGPAFPIDAVSALAAIWLLGALVCGAWAFNLQRRFVRRLGKVIAREDGLLQAEACIGLPAVVGLRSRIVLPADFDSRYTPDERTLILTHERVHVARFDVFGNALAVSVRCVFWFNPLFWIAEDRFRRDQELACDEAVVMRHPRARRAYGEAMMKTQLSPLSVPLACGWFGNHSHLLKERILMLKQRQPSTRRTAAGVLIVSMLACCAGAIAWAAQPPTYVAGLSGYSDKPQTDKRISIIVIDEPVRQVAMLAARLAGIEIENPEALPQDRKVTLDFNSMSIATIMKICADEAGKIALWKNDRVFFFPRGAGKHVGKASKATALSTPAPRYPSSALTADESGKVVMRLRIAADGSVKDADVIESTPAGVFDQLSLAAVRNWRFNAAKKNGAAIESSMDVPILFEASKNKTTASVDVGNGKAANRPKYLWMHMDPRDPELTAAKCGAIKHDKNGAWCRLRTAASLR